MRPSDDDIAILERELRATRPVPRDEFTAELDARAAAGFAKSQQGKPETTRRRYRLQFALGAASIVLITAVAVSTSGLLDEPTDDRLRGLPDIQERSGAPEASQELDAATAEQTQKVPVGPAGRKVARTADLRLSTAPEDLREVADGVVDVTHRYRGFVVTSNVSSGDGSGASADFSLKLPARNLQAAVDELSELAHVSSLTEGTDDITTRFTTARERIAELTEQRERLRAKLAEAGTAEEERAIRVRLREVRAELAAPRRELRQATERVRFVPVHVAIAADAAQADTAWSIRDALDDAVRVLEVAVGVALIMLAIAVPVAIVAALTWLAASAWIHRRRERALDEQPG